MKPKYKRIPLDGEDFWEMIEKGIAEDREKGIAELSVILALAGLYLFVQGFIIRRRVLNKLRPIELLDQAMPNWSVLLRGIVEQGPRQASFLLREIAEILDSEMAFLLVPSRDMPEFWTIPDGWIYTEMEPMVKNTWSEDAWSRKKEELLKTHPGWFVAYQDGERAALEPSLNRLVAVLDEQLGKPRKPCEFHAITELPGVQWGPSPRLWPTHTGG